MKTNKKAISLIVLVITIIVLAILAATVIITITNSGLINSAKDTVKQYDLAQVQEMADLAWQEAYIAQATNPNVDLRQEVMAALVENNVDTTKYKVVVSNSGVTVSYNPNNGGTTVAAGLYETGTNYGTLVTSWEDLLANGTVHVEEGVVYTNGDEETGENTSSAALAGDLVLPTDGSVTLIGYVAFADCTNLASIEIPDSVTSIGEAAFYNCTSLASIEIPDSVRLIGDGAFGACTGLTSIEIPDSVTSIGEVAFAECTSLASIEIPDSVTSIGEAAFYNCTSLASITYTGTVAQFNSVSLGTSWNINVPATEVVCSDGTIALSQSE